MIYTCLKYQGKTPGTINIHLKIKDRSCPGIGASGRGRVKGGGAGERI
jgi:hypothetical protein